MFCSLLLILVQSTEIMSASLQYCHPMLHEYWLEPLQLHWRSMIKVNISINRLDIHQIIWIINISLVVLSKQVSQLCSGAHLHCIIFVDCCTQTPR